MIRRITSHIGSIANDQTHALKIYQDSYKIILYLKMLYNVNQ